MRPPLTFSLPMQVLYDEGRRWASTGETLGQNREGGPHDLLFLSLGLGNQQKVVNVHIDCGNGWATGHASLGEGTCGHTRKLGIRGVGRRCGGNLPPAGVPRCVSVAFNRHAADSSPDRTLSRSMQ